MENDDLWKIYEANKEWIKFADTKAIAFIAIIGVIFNILYKIGSCVIYSRNIFLYISYFGSILCLIFSLFFSIYCIFPRKSETKKNIIYYESICVNFKNENQYHNEIVDANINKQLSSQVYQLAKVAHKKYCIVKKSLIFFGLGIGLIIMFFSIIWLG